jgi:hypothetical protein
LDKGEKPVPMKDESGSPAGETIRGEGEKHVPIRHVIGEPCRRNDNTKSLVKHKFTRLFFYIGVTKPKNYLPTLFV